MGVSTDGLLFLGILIDEESECPWEDEKDEDGETGTWYSWEDHYARLKGCPKPDVPYDTPKNKALHSAYWDAKRKILEACAVEMDTHCSGEYPLWYVALKRLRWSASRGSPDSFEVLPVATDEDRAAVVEFCKLMDIKCEEKPQWHLASYWG